jgi:hypothetical protein
MSCSIGNKDKSPKADYSSGMQNIAINKRERSIKSNISFGRGYNLIVKDLPLPCPYCGKQLRTFGELKAFKAFFANSIGAQAIILLETLRKSLPVLESDAVGLLLDRIASNPSKPIQEILQSTSNSLFPILKEQAGNQVRKMEKYAVFKLPSIEYSYLAPHLKVFSPDGLNKVFSLKNVILQLFHQNKTNRKAHAYQILLNMTNKIPKPANSPEALLFQYNTPSTFAERIYHPLIPTVDHIHPRSLDGSYNPGNLITACPECNVKKDSTLFHEWITPERLPHLRYHIQTLGKMSICPAIMPENTRGLERYTNELEKTIKSSGIKLF